MPVYMPACLPVCMPACLHEASSGSRPSTEALHVGILTVHKHFILAGLQSECVWVISGDILLRYTLIMLATKLMHTYVRAHTHTHTRMHTQAQTHTQTQTHTHTHTRTNTNTQKRFLLVRLLALLSLSPHTHTRIHINVCACTCVGVRATYNVICIVLAFAWQNSQFYPLQYRATYI